MSAAKADHVLNQPCRQTGAKRNLLILLGYGDACLREGMTNSSFKLL